MLSRLIASAMVVVVVAGLVVAGEYTGLVTEHKDGKLTFTVREKGKKGKGEPKTVKVSKDVKITKGEDEVKPADFDKMIEEGAKTKMKGVFAKITTEGEDDKESVTKISIVARKGGKKTEKKKDD